MDYLWKSYNIGRGAVASKTKPTVSSSDFLHPPPPPASSPWRLTRVVYLFFLVYLSLASFLSLCSLSTRTLRAYHGLK